MKEINNIPHSQKKIYYPILIIIIFLLSCNPKAKNFNDLKSAFITFVDAMARRDYRAAEDLGTEKSKAFFVLFKLANQSSEEGNIQFDKIKMKVSQTSIVGDSAFATIAFLETNHHFGLPLKKEKGSWRVVLDNESMLFGMKSMLEDELKGNKNDEIIFIDTCNLDSFEKEVDKALKDAGLDSNSYMKRIKNNSRR
jgi:hypothetical protein